MRKNIILIGMPGAGKSTLGVLLAKALGMDFTDTDIAIQRHEGKLLQEIIDGEGPDGFLKTEESVVSALRLENCVVATGGSVVYSEKAMAALKADGVAVHLFVTYEELRQRLTDIKTRGIVIKEGETLRSIYDERLPLYERYADLTVDCTGRGIETCVGQLVEYLGA